MLETYVVRSLVVQAAKLPPHGSTNRDPFIRDHVAVDLDPKTKEIIRYIVTDRDGKRKTCNPGDFIIAEGECWPGKAFAVPADTFEQNWRRADSIMELSNSAAFAIIASLVAIALSIITLVVK